MGREDVLGCGEALFRVGIGEGQRPHCALDGAAKGVVDTDFLEGGGVGVGNRLAGLGVEQRAGGGLVGDDVIGGIDHEAVVAERAQNGRGLRRRLCGQFSDCSSGLRKFIVEELGQRVVDGVGAGNR